MRGENVVRIVTGKGDCSLNSACSFDQQTAGFVEVDKEQRREKVQQGSVVESMVAHRDSWIVGSLAIEDPGELRPSRPYSKYRFVGLLPLCWRMCAVQAR